MPLQGSGGPLGDALAGAVGAPSSVGGFFAKLGGVIADWAPANIKVKPGTMVAASSAVSGEGTFEREGNSDELGNKLADILDIPADATDARTTWKQFAAAFLDQLEKYGVADGTGLTSGAPACGGAGKVKFTSLAFIPPLATQVDVSDTIAAIALEAFGTMLLNYIQTNGVILAISLTGTPLTAPPDGPVTGTGTLG